MKYTIIYIIALICLSCGSLQAQIHSNIEQTDSVQINIDELPFFSEREFEVYISENYIFTAEMFNTGRPGTLIVNFTVEKDGTITNVEIAKGLSIAQDEEAMRVIKSSSGKWTPGKINGRPISSTFKQSFSFSPDDFDYSEPDNTQNGDGHSDAIKQIKK